jgi:hypothetical protein
MSFLIISRLFATFSNVTHCGPDGLHTHCYNSIQIIPAGIPLDEALALIKKMAERKKE